jgi:hypothetical protein
MRLKVRKSTKGKLVCSLHAPLDKYACVVLLDAFSIQSSGSSKKQWNVHSLAYPRLEGRHGCAQRCATLCDRAATFRDFGLRRCATLLMDRGMHVDY